MNKKVNLILAIGGLFIFILIVKQIGLKNILVTLSNLNFFSLIYIIVFFAISYTIRVWKWLIMDKSAHLEIKKLEIAGFYFHTRILGIITPFRSGESIPTFLTDKKDKFLSITLADRFYESLTTLIIIITASLFIFSEMLNKNVMFLTGFMFMGLISFYLVFTVESVYLIFKSLIRYIDSNGKIVSFSDKLFNLLKQTLRTKTSFFLFFLTILATLSDILFYKYIFNSIGLQVNFTASAATFSFLTLINFISPTPNGLGIGDASYLALNSRFQIGTSTQIGAFLILLRFLSIGLTLLSALILTICNRVSSNDY